MRLRTKRPSGACCAQTAASPRAGLPLLSRSQVGTVTVSLRGCREHPAGPSSEWRLCALGTCPRSCSPWDPARSLRSPSSTRTDLPIHSSPNVPLHLRATPRGRNAGRLVHRGRRSSQERTRRSTVRLTFAESTDEGLHVGKKVIRRLSNKRTRNTNDREWPRPQTQGARPPRARPPPGQA